MEEPGDDVASARDPKADRRDPKADRNPKQRFIQVVALFVAVLLVAIAVLLIWLVFRPPPVPANFTRVGGATRVDTAADAALFWITTPKSVVEPASTAPTSVVISATHCAIDDNAPLLFQPPRGTRDVELDQLVSDWQPSPTKVGAAQMPCSQSIPTALKGRLHSFTGNDTTLLSRFGLRPEDHLAPFVIFAATRDSSTPPPRSRAAKSWEPLDMPDVAVAVALAAHLARTSQGSDAVSVVIVPRYLEADPGLEQKLRDQGGGVLGGVVLGGPGRISEDTQTLLRQILRGPDKAGILGAVHGFLGDLLTVLAAVLALVAGAAATQTGWPLVPAITVFSPGLITRIPQGGSA